MIGIQYITHKQIDAQNKLKDALQEQYEAEDKLKDLRDAEAKLADTQAQKIKVYSAAVGSFVWMADPAAVAAVRPARRFAAPGRRAG